MLDRRQTDAPPFEELEWNANIHAVVGRVAEGIAGFDPIGRKLLYRVPMTDLPRAFRMHWSSDGRWCARRHLNGPAPDEVVFFDGDDGHRVASLAPTLPRTYRAAWSRSGSLFALYARGGFERRTGTYAQSHVDLARAGRRTATIDLSPRALGDWPDIPESSGLAPSPTGDAIALLLDHDEVQLRDATTGSLQRTFAAPAPAIPEGLQAEYREDHHGDVRVGGGALMWLTPDRLVRLAPHFISFWSTDGTKLGELVVSAR